MSSYQIWPKIRGCGHKFRGKIPPNHTNCDTCWFAYFSQQKDFTENLANNIIDQGVEGMKAIKEKYGTKFLRSFLWFAEVLKQYELSKVNTGE